MIIGDQTERTRGIVRQLELEGYPVKIHVRQPSEGKGLSSAVLLGFSMAQNDVVLCMDAGKITEGDYTFLCF